MSTYVGTPNTAPEKEYYILKNMKELDEKLSILKEVAQSLGARVSTVVILSAVPPKNKETAPQRTQSEFASWLEADVEKLDTTIDYLQNIIDTLDL